MSYFIHRITRRKYLTVENVEKTQLARCLNTFDLTALGVGSTLGAGIYVVAGQVAKINSGPSVFLSFLIAAVASILAGLCYAEFGARVPKTGSAYVYSYVTVGELMAFVIGWNLILEYVIGTSSVARAWSLYFDSLIDNKIQNAFREHMPMHITGLSPYPDFFSFGITLLLTVVLAVGVKESSQFNNVFTGVNLLVVTYIIICGAFKADTSNWNIDPEKVTGNVTNTDVGSGGFAPFGISGTLSGAATCFYAFVGFDAIATTGEEVKNPQKAIPISIIISLLVCCFAYSGISIVITLMCPYYLMDTNAPLPAVFERVGWDIAKIIIAIGAICGLSTSLLGAMFPLPRVIYAIASDGLIFRGLATVSERFKTPLIATILSGIFAGLMAMMFDLTELVEMMSIGTLLAYTLVAVSVLLLRYKVESIGGQSTQDALDDGSGDGASDSDTQYKQRPRDRQSLWQHTEDTQNTITLGLLFNFRNKFPSRVTEKLATYFTVIFCFLSVLFGIFLRLAENQLGEGKAWVIVLTVIFCLIMITIVCILGCQPQNQAKITFKVPWVPVLPAISIFVNTFLMIRLPTPTWYRFAIWMALGPLLTEIRPERSEGSQHQDEALSFWNALCLSGVLLYALAYFCLKLVNYSFFFWLPYYLHASFGWSESTADKISIWYDIGGIVGGTIAGVVSDWFQLRSIVMVPMLILSILSLLGYSNSPNDLTRNAVLMTITGYLIGGVANLISAAISADLGKQGPIQRNKQALATVTGIVDGTGSVGAALGQILVPLLQEHLGWHSVFYLFIVMTVLTILCILPMFFREVPLFLSAR